MHGSGMWGPPRRLPGIGCMPRAAKEGHDESRRHGGHPPAARRPRRTRSDAAREGRRHPRRGERHLPQRLAPVDGRLELDRPPAPAAARPRPRVLRRDRRGRARGHALAEGRPRPRPVQRGRGQLRVVPERPPQHLRHDAHAGRGVVGRLRAARRRALRRREPGPAPRVDRLRRGGEHGLPLHDLVPRPRGSGEGGSRRVGRGARLRRRGALGGADRDRARRQRDRGRRRGREARLREGAGRGRDRERDQGRSRGRHPRSHARGRARVDRRARHRRHLPELGQLAPQAGPPTPDRSHHPGRAGRGGAADRPDRAQGGDHHRLVRHAGAALRRHAADGGGGQAEAREARAQDHSARGGGAGARLDGPLRNRRRQRHRPVRVLKRAAGLLAATLLVAGCAALRARLGAPGAERAPAAWDEAAFARKPIPTYRLRAPAETVIGALRHYRIRAGDTLLDVARWFDLGYNEIVDANPGVDPWVPAVGTDVVVPTEWVLPCCTYQGIVVNIPELRLYYFRPAPDDPRTTLVTTYPVGLGRDDRRTPRGKFRVQSKQVNPTWYIPESIRREHIAERGDARRAIPGGAPDNPLGGYRLQLTHRLYGIHGTDVPWGIGMQATPGCVRLYPEAIERLFQLRARGTDLRTEVVGGASTFAALSYIVFVQPAVLATTGMEPGAVLAATCLASAFATALMGLWANYPIAVAPAMGHNFYFALVVAGPVAAGGLGCSWQVALGANCIAGVLFLVLSLVGLRERLIDAIPRSLKHAIAAGIGLLLALVGLEWAGVVRAAPGTLVRLGDLHHPAVLVAIGGTLLVGVLRARRYRGAILAGTLATGGAAVALGLVPYHGLLAAPPSLAPTFARLDLGAALAPRLP